MKTRSIRRRKTVRRKGGAYKDAKLIDKYRFQEEVDDDGSTSLYIWGKNKRSCVTVLLYPEYPATLQHVEYSPSCTEDGAMPRGENGTVKMVQFMLKQVKDKGISEITLEDRSTIKCSNGMEVNLAFFSFIRSGQTWYEKHFGFNLLDTIKAQQYIDAKQKLFENRNPFISLDEYKDLQKKPCEYFTKDIFEDLVKRLKISCIIYTTWCLKL